MADDPSYMVDSENFRTAQDGDSGTVTVDVGLTWAVSSEGGALFSSSETFRWTFTTVNERGFGNGWKVAGIDHPDVCEAYVRC